MIADSVINRSNRCEITRLVRKVLGNRRTLREEKLLPRGGQSNRLLVANFRGQPGIEAYSYRMIHDAIELLQISLSDSLAVTDKRWKLNIEIDFTSFYFAPLARRLKTFLRPIQILQESYSDWKG